ncbi:MAG: DUF4954 family protein [Rikenellaceae bacterium]
MREITDELRRLTPDECLALRARGCDAEDWVEVFVSDDFEVQQLWRVRLSGRVEIGRGVKITESYVANYSIGEGSVVEDVTRLECRAESSFGVGVEVSTINENGGRRVAIVPQLTSQVGYLWAMNRHRAGLLERLHSMAEAEASECRSGVGRIGRRCRIVGARFIRECAVCDGVTIDGASLLECGTILDGAYVGVDVKAREFVVAEGARVDTGATMERCFVGECSIVAAGFSAVESLIFANSHLENGEAAAIFAGAHTVSHHKSSLLIAGLFSHFNAGSGTNQSNHLFKTGAVHQAIHLRGCKFASGAYVMAPAREGAFTMVKGAHNHHHDTLVFPYSYLIEEDGRSKLMPAANLSSYGTMRDISKWAARDKRSVRRDIINYEEHNPYITSLMLRGVNALHTMQEANEGSDEYLYERVVIRSTHLKRGVTLYNKAVAASLGAMLSRGEARDGGVDVAGEWIDLGGAYMPLQYVEGVMDRIESGELASFDSIDEEFRTFAAEYDDHAHRWALQLLAQMLGHTPDAEEVASMRMSAASCEEELAKLCARDGARDNSLSMAVGYGNDYDNEAIREADYRAVRGL